MKTLIFTASILLCSLVFAGANERKAMKTALKGIDEEVKWFYDDCGFKPKVTFEEKDLESFSSKDRTHSRVIFLAGAKCRDIVSSFRNYICSDKEALKGLKEVSEIVCVPNKEALTVEQISYISAVDPNDPYTQNAGPKLSLLHVTLADPP